MSEYPEGLVSIILPVYNCENFVYDAVLSLLRQTYFDIEILILDDGSTDESLNILKKIDDKRISIISRENRGLGASLNELIEISHGKYIARMDSDDISFPDRIKLQYDFLEKNLDVVMVGGQIDFLIKNSNLKTFSMPIGHEKITGGLLEGRFPICHPAIMFRTSIAKKVGGYKVDGAGEDLDFFLRMSECGHLANIPEKVLSYRISGNSLSIRKSAELNRGYAFALLNCRHRMAGIDEMAMGDFNEHVWLRRGVLSKIDEYIKNRSEIFYRKSIIFRSDEKYLRCFLFFLGASLMRPKTVVGRVVSMVEKILIKMKNLLVFEIGAR